MGFNSGFKVLNFVLGGHSKGTLVNEILIHTTLFQHFVFETKLFVSQYPLA